MKSKKLSLNAGTKSVPLLSLAKLEAMEADHDPHVMFHGTSTAYSARIEQNGWVRKSNCSAPGTFRFSHVLPPSSVRNTVPPEPPIQTTLALTACTAQKEMFAPEPVC
jgi:hypothetical protein